MELTWFGHSSFKLRISSETIYIDPVRTNKLLGTTLVDKESADIVLVSHKHWDHFDPVTISQISKETTRFIVSEEIMTDDLVRELTFHVSTIDELKNYQRRMEKVGPGTQKDMDSGNIRVLKASEGICFLVETDYKILFLGDSTLSDEMIETKPDLITIPYWALKETEEQARVKRLSKKTKIIVCHYHFKTMGMPNFFVTEETFKKLISGNLSVILLNKTQPYTLGNNVA